MILRNLLRRKGRTLLTVLGISIGVAAIIGLGTLAGGLESGYTSMLTGSKSDLILSQPDSFDISYSSVPEEVSAEISQMTEVAAASGMLQGFVQTEGAPFFFVFGFPEDSYVIERFQIISGTSLTGQNAQRLHGKSLILGSAAAEMLKKKPGDTIRMGDSVYRVAGIYQTGDAFEDGGAVLRLSDAQTILGKPRQVSLVYVQLKDSRLKDRIQRRVERQWPDLELNSTTEYADKQLLGDMLYGYVWIIAGLAILIGGVGMMNAQLMAVVERTREIGVLRALGWSQWRVLAMILGESLLVGMAGGILGVFLGWLVLTAIPGAASIFGASARLDPGLIGQAFLVVATLGLFGGLYPAWRAARLQPVEALRYEGGSSGRHLWRVPIGGMAVQSLTQRMTRTLFTLAVIGLTVGVIMALEGIVREVSSTLAEMAGEDVEIMIRQAGVADTEFSAIDKRVGGKIAALPEVRSTSGVLFTAVLLPENSGFFIMLGYSPNEPAIQRFNVVEGNRIATNHQVMIGRSMSEALKRGVGDTIELGGSRFKIVGVYESSVSWEELGGVVTLRDAQTFAGRPNKVTMYAVDLMDPDQAVEVVEKINAEFPEIHASLTGEFVEQMPDMANAGAMLNGISLLAILVGGVGILNTMLMSVLERTREIGVLRALGWRRLSILWMIMKEALYLGILGAIAGIAIAYGLVFLSSKAPMIGEAFQAEFSWDVFARAIIVAVSLGVIGGLYPAYRATRLQPVEALRYE